MGLFIPVYHCPVPGWTEMPAGIDTPDNSGRGGFLIHRV